MNKLKNVIESLQNEPEKWKQEKYTLCHESGTRLWTSNAPIINTNYYPRRHLSMRSKYRLWRAMRRWGNRLSM